MLQKELAKQLKARYVTKMDGNGWLVHDTRMAFPALRPSYARTCRRGALSSTDNPLLPLTCGRMAVLLHAFLHTVEQVFWNDSRNTALNYNILIAILANIFAVF